MLKTCSRFRGSHAVWKVFVLLAETNVMSRSVVWLIYFPNISASELNSMVCVMFPGFTAGKSLGCYRDEKNFRLLSGYYANLKTTNSPKHCINMCLQSGFPYAGVQYS